MTGAIATSTSRRGFVAAIGLAAGAGALAASTGVRASSRSWDALYARYLKASDAADTHRENIYQPAEKRIDAAAGKAPPMWFEHTAKSGAVARFAVQSTDIDMPNHYPFAPKYRAMARAHAEWWERWQRLDRDPAWRAIANRQEKLDDALDAARIALMKEPAPDGTALALKVQLAMANDELWDTDRMALIADAGRLAG